MQTVFISFVAEDDRARGFYELATRARIGSFPGGIYQVPVEALQLLDDRHISYRRATDEEVRAAPGTTGGLSVAARYAGAGEVSAPRATGETHRILRGRHRFEEDEP